MGEEESSEASQDIYSLEREHRYHRHARCQAGRLAEDRRPTGRNSPSRKVIKLQHKDDQAANLSFGGGGKDLRVKRRSRGSR